MQVSCVGYYVMACRCSLFWESGIFRGVSWRRCCKRPACWYAVCRLRLKCDGTRAETRFRLSAKRMSPFKSAGAWVQSSTGSWGVRVSGSNAGYTMFRGSVKGFGYTLHSPSLPFTSPPVCHQISNALCYSYFRRICMMSFVSEIYLSLTSSDFLC